MKEEWKPDELRATSEEIRGAVMPKSITPDMVGGTLLGLVNAVGEIVETLGEIPREHVRVRVNTLDTEGRTAYSTEATVYVDIFTTKGYPAVNIPRQELTVNEEGLAEFDVPHGFQFAVVAKHPGLSASFQWVYTAAVDERPIIVLWCVPVGVWWMGAIFHGGEESDPEWGDEEYRPTPFLFDCYVNEWEAIRERANIDLRPGEVYIDYYAYGIMIATADTCFVISEDSESEQKMTWCDYCTAGMYVPGMECNVNTFAPGWFGNSFDDARARALSDMDGNLNTAKILNAGYGTTAARQILARSRGYEQIPWLPSAGQMALIQLNRKAINKLMSEALNDGWEDFVLLPDFEPGSALKWSKKEEWWTSTVFNDISAWYMTYDGVLSYALRCHPSSKLGVRPVFAYRFLY